MGSMNWLGFSLSPQELPSQAAGNQDHSQSTASRVGFNSEEISGTDVSGECFDLTSDTAAHSLNHLPPSFAIFEAFNRNTSTSTSTPHKYHNHTQDWNIRLKGLEDKYKSSESSGMVMGSSYSSQNLDKSQQEPKLENFLGRHSFADHDDHQDHHATSASVGDYMFSNVCSLQLPADQTAETSSGGVGASSSIGLSMIKTWLRNQPITPSQNSDNNNTDSGAGGTSTQSLSLSMSSSSPLALLAPNESCSSDNKQPTTNSTGIDTQSQTPSIDQATPRKSIDTFGQRTSIYRGVTRHRWTGRYEAHLWDNSCRREGQTRKGRQVYLGGYDKEEKAARAYDLAALKYWGTTTTTNFPISNYEKELEEMKHMTRQEYVASLRRKSSGFSRGASIYRGVTRHHQHGRWQARIGRVAGNKDLYLGTFSTQEEAAEAYDIAAIKFRGLNAVTNFDMNRYDVKSILESSTLPIGGAAKRLKEHVEQPEIRTDHHDHDDNSHGNGITTIGTNVNVVYGHGHGWPSLAFQSQPQPYTMHYPYGSQSQRLWCKQEQDSDASHCHSFQDLHQLQLGSTHNFFQSSNSATSLHNINIMTMDSPANSMDNSCGSNSVIYGGDHGSIGYGGSGSGGYMIPMATVIANDHGNQNQTCNGFADENVFGAADPYHARNLYNYSSGDVLVKASTYDQGNTNWVPTAVPTLAPRSSSTNMPLCPGAPPFTLLHD